MTMVAATLFQIRELGLPIAPPAWSGRTRGVLHGDNASRCQFITSRKCAEPIETSCPKEGFLFITRSVGCEHARTARAARRDYGPTSKSTRA